MSTFYKSGREGSWGGYCEVAADRTRYRWHKYWPERTPITMEFEPLDALDELIRDGWWIPVAYPDPDLCTDEGL